MKLSASKLLDNLKKMKELEVSDIKQEHQKLMMITLGGQICNGKSITRGNC